ncbi:GNAT family N-acetyltransferase [Bacillus cytotoxicus]|uniref:GNAT family N-acetyltransferase n=1 Tax=Bacillus cytotoxicus TaxID=580165 RepID=UPI00069F8554|nr:hypothetical protein [Bacillus cytotoxicus]AWC32510.1 hypothetical protein CG482_008750 [Bacillus cytotoxicus]AWC36538.1 hypothetical protein CG481_008760 [Bacillus cytotoxicus]AWC60792.1 hypothetical protein CG474_008825 [Bacillus cytotoxicus]HDR7308716.1 hypothetical protein [Bacillus cytotoxicus]HDR7862460.1 hypothetical protein [Bacillus cytotoxicus]
MRIRKRQSTDIEAITRIYNQGIRDRIATLEENEKTIHDMEEWFVNRGERYAVLVAEMKGQIVRWVSSNFFVLVFFFLAVVLHILQW